MKKGSKITGTNEIKVCTTTDKYYVNVTVNYKSISDSYFIELDRRIQCNLTFQNTIKHFISVGRWPAANYVFMPAVINTGLCGHKDSTT